MSCPLEEFVPAKSRGTENATSPCWDRACPTPSNASRSPLKSCCNYLVFIEDPSHSYLQFVDTMLFRIYEVEALEARPRPSLRRET